MNTLIDECPFNIGKSISDFLTANGISVESAAEKSGIELNKFREILEQKSIDSKSITEISVALSHNFMTEIADFVDKELGNC